METMSKLEILETLQALKPELIKRYHVKGMELFGSAERDEQHSHSEPLAK
ncbi:hypothetical protein SAMN02745220_03741 [Desulfopila aestuarii DSM 18488]|uniref:Uncharacterized protein n=1 Tax=Desulfopila aestuarii DSM 18488 TaxID=1121416 RepID=A0A1M7YEC2_9BACT|nr:hypothetical protein SAMN02745220_03741 [Desulfopila aestuarii DSM 18488]